MLTLHGTHIFLRALEPEDLEFIYRIENDEAFWEISNTQTPYSHYLVAQYLKNAHQDIFEAKQLRLAICSHGSTVPLGLIDLFEYDPKNNRAGVGIMITEAGNRNSGIGSDALATLIKYAFRHLNLHQLYANVDSDNAASIGLFSKFAFEQIGVKKQWNLVRGEYKDEIMYQLIKTL